MTGTKGMICITVLILVTIACISVPAMAGAPSSGNASANASQVSHYYDEGTHTGNTEKNSKKPPHVLPVIPPGVPRTIPPVKDTSTGTFTDIASSMPVVETLADHGQKKHNNTPQAEESAGIQNPGVDGDNSSTSAGDGLNSPQYDVPAKGPRWLNTTGGSLNNLTRDDPLYVSWTKHLDTPRAISLNNTSLNISNNVSDTGAGETQSYGTLTQDQVSKVKGTAHIRITAMAEKMETLKSYTQNSSSLTDDQKTHLSIEAENTASWLSGKDAEIQSLNDVDSVGGILVDVENRISLMEADLQRNMGLLACNEMDSRIGEALNASLTLEDRIDHMNLGDADRAITIQYFTDCREHLLNASMQSDCAAQYFEDIDGQSSTDGNYSQGMDRLQQSKKELNLAYLAINKIFHKTVDNQHQTNTNN